MTDKPNILLLTTGCANSTTTVRQLAALGWHTGDVDKYAENVRVRSINYAIIKRKPFDADAATAILAELSSPWVVKHPEFAHTLQHWHDVFAPYRPLLLYITKSPEYVRNSFKRRFNMDPKLADKRRELCDQHYREWPFARLHFDVDQLAAAIRLFDPKRAFAHAGLQ